MTTKTYKLDDGKYTIVYDNCNNIVEVLRYNKPWLESKDVLGINAFNMLFYRVLELEEQLLNIELDKDK